MNQQVPTIINIRQKLLGVMRSLDELSKTDLEPFNRLSGQANLGELVRADMENAADLAEIIKSLE